jgi:uncharacterized membrane protein (UPF0127 family)
LRILGLTFALLALMSAGCSEASESLDAASPQPDNPSRTTTEATQASRLRTVTIHASNGEQVRLRVEIADDVSEQTRGLMYRTALAEDRGMLFIFPHEEIRSFWMKNTLIPLSIAYLNSEGRIVDIQDMKPLDDDLPHYVSAEPARYALEVNQDFFEEHGVKVGDRAELPV